MHNHYDDFREVFFALCKSVNTPYSLGMYLRWKHRCYSDAPPPDPKNYDDPYLFSRDYLVYSWPAKAQYNLESRDLGKIALDGFIADESWNSETTERLKAWMSGACIAPPLIEGILPRIQRKISEVLGPLRLGLILDDCRIGNGATVSLSRRRARFDKKMTTLPLTVTPDAFELGRCLVEHDPAWLSAILRVPGRKRGVQVVGPCSLIPKKVFQLVGYNKFDTVPKSLKTDRTIAKEPVLNGILQQSVHVYLRARLQRVGVDLRDQSVNQWLARVAHWAGLATLDLRSASNSLTETLIYLLFPHDWYVFLDVLRSAYTELPDGTLHKNVMFSSMGNAFTFEVETLVFWAIASSVVESHGVVSVYGDDIIVPQRDAAAVIESLTFFGFRINTGKSFTEGRFFESCGKHYFDGVDVTPVFQKKAPRYSLLERIRANNRLIRWSQRTGVPELELLDSTVRAACNLLRRTEDNSVPQGPVNSLESDAFAQNPEWAQSIRFSPSGQGTIWGLRERYSRKRTRQQAGLAYFLRLHRHKKDQIAVQTVPPEYYHRLTAVLGDSQYRRQLLCALDVNEGSLLSEATEDDEDTVEIEKVRVEVARESIWAVATWA